MSNDARDKHGDRRWDALAWYLAIAAFNAAFYVGLCEAFSALRFSASAAGIAALVPVLVVSYIGHKKKTFRSEGAHRDEAPRFIVLGIVDLMLAGLVPYLGHLLHAPPIAAFVALTAIVPAANFLIMRFWVFARR